MHESQILTAWLTKELSENRGAFMIAPIYYGRKKLTPRDSNPSNSGSQLFSVTTEVFSPVVIFDVVFFSILYLINR